MKRRRDSRSRSNARAPDGQTGAADAGVPVSLLRAADLGLLRYDHATAEIRPTPTLARLLDLPGGDQPCPLATLLSRLPRRDRVRAVRHLRELPQTSEPARFISSFRTPRGETRYARVTLMPDRGDDGTFRGALGLVADETEAVRQARAAANQFSVAEAYFRNSPTPTAVFERIQGDEYLIDFNDALDRLTSGGIRDQLGQPSDEYTRHGQDQLRTGILESVRDCLASGSSLSRRFSFFDDVYKQEPSVVDIAFSFAPPNRVILQIHSLTEIMNAYNASKQAERDYRTLAEHAPVGIFRVDTSGTVSYANPGIREMLSPTKLSGVRCLPGALAAAVARCLETLRPEAVRYPAPDHTDKAPHWLESHLRPEQSADGEPMGVLGITTDVTKDVLAATAIEKREQQLRSVFDNIADAIIVADEQGRIRVVNDAFQQLSGYQPRDIIGQPVDMLVPDDVEGTHAGFIDQYRRTGRARFIGQGPRELELETADGGRIPVELSVSESSLEDGMRFIASMRDLRERRAEEERRRRMQKMEALGQLTGGVAHDFNNVLSVIKGNVELIAHYSGGNAEIEELVENLELAIDQGTGLTSQLLAFSRQDQGRTERLHLGEIARDAERLLRPNLGIHVELAVDVDPNLWTTRANRNDLLNVIVNLVLNSRDAIDDTGTVTVSARNEAAGSAAGADDHVALAVRDTGRGIPKELLDHVCEPFFTTKESGVGTGLGLSMAQAFAVQNGGNLTVESRPGHGTTVTVRLPRDTTGDLWCDEQAGDDDTRVVIVERDEALASFISAALTGQPHRPCVTANARAALSELAGHRSVSTLVTNVLLPHGVKGVDVALAARKLHPDVACIFVSASKDGHLNAEASQIGQVLTVPLSEAELVDCLNRARRNQ